MRLLIPVLLLVVSASCIRPVPGPLVPPEIHVAAASNMSRLLEEINNSFEKNTQIHVVASYGATGQLARQIEAGAPYDVFLAADVAHIDDLITKGLAPKETKEIYAKGELAVYSPGHPNLKALSDLVNPKVLDIFVAKPELAPYGAAAVEALKNAKLWDKLEAHTKYAASASAAKQYADTGNCDAAITALSLVYDKPDAVFVIDSALHKPIQQALCIMKNSKQMERAKLYTSFLTSMEARAKFKKFGYAH